MNSSACSGRRACGNGPRLAFGVFERVGAGHHVDRVDEELGGDARFALVLGEPEEPEPGMTTTDGFESRSAGEAVSANDW